MTTMNVEFVRAGAGSGKTYHLTHLLADRLRTGSARPSAVIATTFTVKAATELRERARATLLQQGRLDLSAAIGQARIGTVNSVCGQLIQRFCFELGISPEQTVLDEAAGKRLVRMAIETVQTPDETRDLMAVATRLCVDHEQLTEAIRQIMDAARANDLCPGDVENMGVYNADAMLGCWPAPAGDHTASLLHAIDAALPQLEVAQNAGNRTKVLTEGIDALRQASTQFTQGRWTWAEWHRLSEIEAGRPQEAIVETVREVARNHPIHDQFHSDIRLYLASVFTLAARALEAFTRTKVELGVVDFTDQEVMLLRAIRESELVRQALREEVDLVLVDEFQDTSPLQLAIFVELAKLANASIWVGDQKQAIYGFRGTDSSLIQQVLASMQAWGGNLGTALRDSWRSTPALVELTNATFIPDFAPAPPQDIALTPRRGSLAPRANQPDLLNWAFSRKPKGRSLNVTAIGPAVAQLLGRGIQVEQKGSNTLRPLRPDDIAVLCRTGKNVTDVVAGLSRWGIAAAAERPGLLSTPEAQLVLACLRRLHDPADTLASATIVSLTESLEPEQWLHDRLQYLSDSSAPDGQPTRSHRDWRVHGADAHPLLARLELIRPRLLLLTPREALRLAKAESGVARLAYQWSDNERSAQVRIANIEALLERAGKYEEACTSARQPATVNGLLLWLGELAAEGEDGRAAAAHGAVEVMTMHAAKGLEWPVVIVAGIHHAHRTDLWAVRARTLGEFDAGSPLAERVIHYWPFPYGNFRNVPAAQGAEQSATGQMMELQALEENTRLLYVTLTRARDMLVLVADIGRAADTTWLDETRTTGALWGPAEELHLNGTRVLREHAQWDWAAASATPPSPERRVLRYFEAGSPVEHPPLWCTPSATDEEGFCVTAQEDVGTRIAVRPATDMTALGSALHACIAYATADTDTLPSEAEIEAILLRWGVAHAIEPAAAVGQVQAFAAWVCSKWPAAQREAEIPVEARRPDGTIIRGQIDMLVRVQDGRILIDHKADPRRTDGNRLAVAHGGQLEAYAQAVEHATGDRVLERWLFLPVAGKAVRIGGRTAERNAGIT